MENNTIKLTAAQESFVKMANEQGFTNTITRKDIISLKSSHSVKWPTWLVKNTAYRVGRASYSLPTIGQTMESDTTKTVSE
jgi:hypothetical protein